MQVRWQECNGAIDLLFTDLVLPGGITGQMLADDLLQHRPNLPVIYASGYSADVLSGRLQVKPGVTYLRKPYSFHEITSIVRRRLDGVSGKA